MVVMSGIDPLSSPYEGGAHPSTPHHLFGIPAGTRTPTNSFGDWYAAITLPRYFISYRTQLLLLDIE